MDFTEIFSGMPQGPEAIQGNFKKISDSISDTGWTNSGMTYLNGTKASDDGGVFYRKVSLFGGGYLVELRGFVIAPSSDGSGYIVQLPQSIIPAKNIFHVTAAIYTNGRIYAWDYKDSSGHVNIYCSYLVD